MFSSDRVQFVTRDPETAYQFLQAAYGGDLVVAGLAPGDVVSLTCHELSQVRLSRCSSAASLRWATRGLGRLVISQPLAGSQVRRQPTLHDRLRPGDVAVLAPPHRPVRGVNDNLTHRVVSIDLALLSSLADERGEQLPPLTSTLADCRPLSHRDGQRWSQVIDIVDDLLARGGDDRLLCRNAERFVAASALSLFTSVPGEADNGGSRSADAAPLIVKRSIQFIESNADKEITVDDIAQATNVTARSVQLAFRKHLDTTPSAYLRTLRIQRAHSQLRTADPSRGDTVTDIAAQWGFFSPGRFSAQYRQIYGVSPSQTLRT